MTNLENYKKRKLKELSILNEYIGDKIDLSNCDTEKDILEYKNLIIKNLRNDNREKFYHHLTNNNQINFQMVVQLAVNIIYVLMDMEMFTDVA